MTLLPDRDRASVRSRLDAVTRPVTILLFTQAAAAPEHTLLARQVVDELAALNELLAIEDVDIVLEKERAAAYGIDRTPAIALVAEGADTRMRFLGAPAGYELMSLVEAIVLAGTGSSGLSPTSRALIGQHVTSPIHIRVFVTPTCRYCPAAVTLAHRLAVESPLITATCIDATEFIDLSQRYRVTGVPKTLVDQSIEIFGALPEAAFVRETLGLPAA